MSLYVFMKALESAASRYDRGMEILTRGHITRVQESIAARVAAPGRRILDVGCGTGGVTLACARRGATVIGIDSNAEMLRVARSKPHGADPRGSVEWIRLGAAEIEDRFPPDSFDAVTACLVFSELSVAERTYALGVALTRLRPGGRLLIADEVWPASRVRRALHRLRRLPVAALTYALARVTTRPVEGLVELVREAGFVDVIEERREADFAIVHARRLEDCA